MMRKKKHFKLQTYRLALPEWSIGTEIKGNARSSQCKEMDPDSKRTFKKCVLIKGLCNGACADCYHYCYSVDCNLYD